MTTRVELFLEARGLPKLDVSSQTDAFAIVYAKPVGPTGMPSATWVEVGRTSVQYDTATPRWATQFVVDYAFETVQPLRIVLWDFDSLKSHDYIGACECRPRIGIDVPAVSALRCPPPPSQVSWRRL